MRFESTYSIYIIIAAAVLASFMAWAYRARRISLERFAQKELLPELLGRLDRRLRLLKTIFLICAVFFFLTALARPQWGFQWQEIKAAGIDILVALDTSKSMLATDIKPDRLARSKLALRDFSGRLKGDRIGLIAFAGSAFLQCPLTVDYNGFLLALEDISTDTIPKGGTSISSAIREASAGYAGGAKKHKVLVIITDGEDHGGDVVQAAQDAKKEGIVVYCIGIGTSEGDLIFVESGTGKKEYLKDNAGNAVKSRLNEEVLQKVCIATGGTYVRSTSAEFGLDYLYNEKLSKLEKSELASKMNKLYVERFQLPLLIGFLFLMLEILISDRKKDKT